MTHAKEKKYCWRCCQTSTFGHGWPSFSSWFPGLGISLSKIPTFSMEYLDILHMFLLMNYGRFKIQIVLSFAHFEHKNGGSLTFSNDPKVSSSCFWMSFLPSLILHQFWILKLIEFSTKRCQKKRIA